MATRLEYCSLDAAAEVMTFLRDHWSSGHVLARSRKLFDWQYRDEAAGRYNFLLARDEAGAIAGLLGFIPMSRYDPVLAVDDETVWFAVWKVRDDGPPGLGLMLVRTLQARLRPKWIGTVGLNDEVRGIYTALGYRTGRLPRFYRLADRGGWKLAVVPPSWAPPSGPSGETRLQPIDAGDFWSATRELGLDSSRQAPRKTRASFHARYVAHPFYDYRLYLAADDGSAALIAVRACRHEDGAALRIVDLLGDPAALASCGSAFEALMREAAAEYVDFYFTGPDQPLIAAGFRLLVDGDGVVLPSYFEPFERRNVDILYAIAGPDAQLFICKGDADQDRPNIVDEGLE